METKKPTPIDIARKHQERVMGLTKKIIGPDEDDLRTRRKAFIDKISIMSEDEKDRFRNNLRQRIERLSDSNMGGTL